VDLVKRYKKLTKDKATRKLTEEEEKELTQVEAKLGQQFIDGFVALENENQARIEKERHRMEIEALEKQRLVAGPLTTLACLTNRAK